MKRLQRLDLALVTALLITFAAGFSGPADAQLVSGEQTVFTTTTPLRVGDSVLEPGTYDLHVLTANGNLVVLNHDTKQIVAKGHTIPHQRDKFDVDGTPSFVYYPHAPDLPQTLRTWFPSTGVFGRDIVYGPQVEREIRLALVRAAERKEELRLARLETERREAEADLAEATAAAVMPLEAAEPVPLVAEQRYTARTELPRTASKAPLGVAIGVSLLLAAALLGILRRLAA
jgi:hypothetical protein